MHLSCSTLHLIRQRYLPFTIRNRRIHDVLICLPSTLVPSLLLREQFHLDVLLQYFSVFRCIQKLLSIVPLRFSSVPDLHFL